MEQAAALYRDSIHGNGTTPQPHRPNASNGDPFFYAFAGRNQARMLHDADVARRRPPATRRTNQPRRPTEQIAPALGVLLTRAASLRATEPLTQGALLDRIFSNFHVANAHVVDAVPNTFDVPPLNLRRSRPTAAIVPSVQDATSTPTAS